MADEKKVKTHIRFEGTIDLIELEEDVKETPMDDAAYAEDIKQMILGDISQDVDEDEQEATVTIKILERKQTAA